MSTRKRPLQKVPASQLEFGFEGSDRDSLAESGSVHRSAIERLKEIVTEHVLNSVAQDVPPEDIQSTPRMGGVHLIRALLDCLNKAERTVLRLMRQNQHPLRPGYFAGRLLWMAEQARLTTRAVQDVYDRLELKGFVVLREASQANHIPAVYQLRTDEEIWQLLRSRGYTHWRQQGKGRILLSTGQVDAPVN